MPFSRAHSTPGTHQNASLLDTCHLEVMWCDDYPHGASTWPESRAVVAETVGDLAAADRERIVRDNAARLYDIDVRD